MIMREGSKQSKIGFCVGFLYDFREGGGDGVANIETDGILHENDLILKGRMNVEAIYSV